MKQSDVVYLGYPSELGIMIITFILLIYLYWSVSCVCFYHVYHGFAWVWGSCLWSLLSPRTLPLISPPLFLFISRFHFPVGILSPSSLSPCFFYYHFYLSPFLLVLLLLFPLSLLPLPSVPSPFLFVVSLFYLGLLHSPRVFRTFLLIFNCQSFYHSLLKICIIYPSIFIYITIRKPISLSVYVSAVYSFQYSSSQFSSYPVSSPPSSPSRVGQHLLRATGGGGGEWGERGLTRGSCDLRRVEKS